MSVWFWGNDPFTILPGAAACSIGAPHHGERPNVDADRGTGPITRCLAQQLDARGVIVTDLRRVADVNKDPQELAWWSRRYALRYQNALFAGVPNLVVEIHGQRRGQYEVEISTGYDLCPQQDGDYLEHLRCLKEALELTLPAAWGRRVSVGVYPLDRDVRQTATHTFTFQKIRRLRNLAGMICYGVHIELDASLRVEGRAILPEAVAGLGQALAQGIRSAFYPLSQTRQVLKRVEPVLLAVQRLRVDGVPADLVQDGAVFVHPQRLRSLGCLEGDRLILRSRLEDLNCTVLASPRVQPDCIGVPARLRGQIAVRQGEMITAGRVGGEVERLPAGAVVCEIRPGKEMCVWVRPEDAATWKLQPGKRIRISSYVAEWAGDVVFDPVLPAYSAAVSAELARALYLTHGDVILFMVGS